MNNRANTPAPAALAAQLAPALEGLAPAAFATGSAPVINQFYISNSNINAGRDMHTAAPELAAALQAQAATISRLLGIIEAQARQLEALTASRTGGTSTQ